MHACMHAGSSRGQPAGSMHCPSSAYWSFTHARTRYLDSDAVTCRDNVSSRELGPASLFPKVFCFSGVQDCADPLQPALPPAACRLPQHCQALEAAATAGGGWCCGQLCRTAPAACTDAGRGGSTGGAGGAAGAVGLLCLSAVVLEVLERLSCCSYSVSALCRIGLIARESW